MMGNFETYLKNKKKQGDTPTGFPDRPYKHMTLSDLADLAPQPMGNRVYNMLDEELKHRGYTESHQRREFRQDAKAFKQQAAGESKLKMSIAMMEKKERDMAEGMAFVNEGRQETMNELRAKFDGKKMTAHDMHALSHNEYREFANSKEFKQFVHEKYKENRLHWMSPSKGATDAGKRRSAFDYVSLGFDYTKPAEAPATTEAAVKSSQLGFSSAQSESSQTGGVEEGKSGSASIFQ